MIEERAVVVALDGGHAWLEAAGGGGCGRCAAAPGCGSRSLAALLGRRPLRVRVANTLGATVGDDVLLGLAEGALLGAAFRAYAVPLAGMLAGAAAAHLLGGADLAAGLGAASGLVAGIAWVARRNRAGRSDPRFEPVMIRVLGRQPAAGVAAGV